ncbi:hypothetical protein FRB91_010500 [Serendipita sp. 411]|nr:hypothetical protein FRB91_010500 [Serendipita sp. 411]
MRDQSSPIDRIAIAIAVNVTVQVTTTRTLEYERGLVSTLSVLPLPTDGGVFTDVPATIDDADAESTPTPTPVESTPRNTCNSFRLSVCPSGVSVCPVSRGPLLSLYL